MWAKGGGYANCNGYAYFLWWLFADSRLPAGIYEFIPDLIAK